jgi:predicted transcriptional regulator
MLHASGQFISYGAVKTVLDRLTAKQILQRDRADLNYLYTACCSRDVFEHQAIAEIIGRLLHDYGDSVYASLDKLDARVVVV